MAEVPVSMVHRVARILRAFEAGPPHLSLAEISELTQLPKSSTFRILQQLVESELIERHDGKFRLGLNLFELGTLVQHRDAIVTLARPYLQGLCVAGRYAAHLAILDEGEIVYLDKVGGKFAGGLPSRVGGRFVAHHTAVGKAMLADSNEEFLEEYFDERLDGGQSVIGRRLKEELKIIRNRGFAVEYGEAIPGVACVGAPITHRGTTVAAISITGPTKHLEVGRVKGSVQFAAASISRGLHPRYEALRPAG